MIQADDQRQELVGHLSLLHRDHLPIELQLRRLQKRSQHIGGHLGLLEVE